MRPVQRTAARRKSAAPEGPATGTHRTLKRESLEPLVLLVDDVDDTREMYAESFEYRGWRVSQAVDGEHALWKIISLMPDIVVMDLSMPILDGWNATREIKAHPKTKHIPVIVLTGHATPTAITEAEKAGADVVLVKPCTPSTLLSILERFVTRERG